MARMMVVRKRVEPRQEESRDVYELASEAAGCLEAYRRAPWTQINDRIRLHNLARALELLQRAHDIETGKIPPPIWGDV
ncbi:MAG TPA: hypothetical protein VKT49_12995 [Bryobacteraceae bacterium]|nr:hypothetical protein [Bryobacteraceae bacterium]